MAITKVSNYEPQNQYYQEFISDREELNSFLHITAPAFDTVMELSATLISAGVLHGVSL